MATFSTRVRTLTELATAVRDARIAAGMSQEELAAAAGLRRSWVSLFEGGHSPNASLFKVLAMADALDMTIRATYPVPDAQKSHDLRSTTEDQTPPDEVDPPTGSSAPVLLDPVALATARAQRSTHRGRALVEDLSRGPSSDV